MLGVWISGSEPDVAAVDAVDVTEEGRLVFSLPALITEQWNSWQAAQRREQEWFLHFLAQLLGPEAWERWKQRAEEEYTADAREEQWRLQRAAQKRQGRVQHETWVSRRRIRAARLRRRFGTDAMGGA